MTKYSTAAVTQKDRHKAQQLAKQRARTEATRLLTDALQKLNMTTKVDKDLVEKAFRYRVDGRVRIFKILPHDRKKAALDVVAAIDKLKRALPKLRYAELDIKQICTPERLDEWRREAKLIANEKLPNTGPSLTREARKKKNAVGGAAHLLLAHGLPLTIADGGLFHQVSLAIYGDPKSNLKHLLEKAKAEAKAFRQDGASEGVTVPNSVP